MGVDEVKAKFDIESPLQVIDMLGLMGDSSDNIPGCPGVGEKTAQKLVAQFGSIENLLEHTEELKGALKTKVENNKEMILFSKFLATIKTDVPIELNMEDLQREAPDEEALRKIFEEMEFRSLMERVFNREKKITTTENTIKKPVGQPDLFNGQLSLFGDTPTPSTTSKGQKQGNLLAEFADDGQGDSKFSNLANLESLPYNYQLIDNED